MNINIGKLIDFTDRANRLQAFLDSDEIIDITDEEFILLENMHKALEAYCVVLKQRIKREDSIIKLKDTSHG